MAELTVMVPLGDREVEMRKPTEGALVVLSKVFRGLPKAETEAADITDAMRDRLIRNIGILGDVIEAMIVNPDDVDWLDNALIDGAVPVEDVFNSIRIAGEKFNGGASGKGPQKATASVRRVRAR